MNKEVNDALHTLLNISLKDKSFSTQKQQFKIVYNYITNLQEENKDLKYSNIYLSKTCDRYKITVRNYKSRNKKAIEYIKKNTDYYSKMCLMGLSDKECEMLLNILEGDDKE